MSPERTAVAQVRAVSSHAPPARPGAVLLAICCCLSAASAQWLETTVFTPDSFGGLSMPNCLVYDPTDNTVFVAGEQTSTILVLDAKDGHRLARIPFAGDVRALCYNSVSNKVYAAAADLDKVAVIDAGSMQLVKAITVGAKPVGLAYNPALNRVYCVNLISFDVAVIDGAGDNVIATVRVGRYPSAACWNPTRNVVYVANSNDNTVSVIDATADTVAATIAAGNAPIGFVYNPDLNKLYEADYASGNVTVIDGLTDTVLATIEGGWSPVRLCYNPTDSKVYVADEDDRLMIIDCVADTVLDAAPGHDPHGVDVAYNVRNDCVYTIYHDAFEVIDGATNAVTSIQAFGGNDALTICIADSGRRAFSTAEEDAVVGVLNCEEDTLMAVVGTRAQTSALCLNPAAHKVYCADSAANVVMVLDDETNAITAVIPAGQCPGALLYDSVSHKVYCAGTGGDYEIPATLVVIDGAGDSVLKILQMAEVYEPVRQTLCLNTADDRVYVGNPRQNEVIVVDATADTVIANVPAGGDPSALCYNPAFNYVYVAAGRYVGVIDCEQNVLIAVDTVGSYSVVNLCYVPVGARVYTANEGGSVSVIAGERPQVVAEIDIGGRPSALCWDSIDNKVFCANRADNDVAVIDAGSNTVVARVAVGAEPVALSYDSPNDYVYCACRGSSEVYVINAHRNRVVINIAVGPEPCALAWNPIELRTYVLNHGNSSVSVLRDSLHVGVAERPLAEGSEPQATVVRGVLLLPRDMTELAVDSDRVPRPVLLDVSGRKVADLFPGANDIQGLAPGVYFIRDRERGAWGEGRTRKVVITR
jgi:YVTN family beta-propeller protein